MKFATCFSGIGAPEVAWQGLGWEPAWFSEIDPYASAVLAHPPLEAERLQGFPDDWTKVRINGKAISDKHRYKCVGNSMAVPVMRWLGERIQTIVDLEKNGILL